MPTAAGEPGRIVGRRIDQLEPGEADEAGRRPASMPSHRGSLSGGGSALDRPSKASTIRHGAYQGLIQYQRLPNTPCTSVRPTQSSVQTVSGSGLDSGSRLPRNPAATRIAKTAKESEAERQPQRFAQSYRVFSRHGGQPFQPLGPDEQQHEESSPPPRSLRRRDSGRSAKAAHGRDRRRGRGLRLE